MYILRMVEKFNRMYMLLKAETPINIAPELKETFVSVNETLSDVCDIAIKLLFSGKQLVFMTDAGFRSAGYVLLIDDNPDRKLQSNRKRTTPWRSYQIFSPLCISDIHLLERVFSSLHGTSRDRTYFVGNNKANDCPHRKNSVISFVQTKEILPALWEACDYVLEFKFKLAQNADSVNIAAQFTSRFELKVTDKMRLKIREDIQMTPIYVTKFSWDVAGEEHIFITQSNNEEESDE